MHSKVRDLYRRFLYVGKDYPLGLDYVRDKVKIAFMKNRHLKTEEEINRAVHRGRFMVKEMVGVIQLKKYRTMNSRYTSEDLRNALARISRLSEEKK